MRHVLVHGSETALAVAREAEVNDPPVVVGHVPAHEPGVLGALDELGHRALGELEALAEIAHGRLLAPVGSALDHEEEEVAARGQPVPPRRVLAYTQETAEGRPELGDRKIVVEPGTAL